MLFSQTPGEQLELMVFASLSPLVTMTAAAGLTNSETSPIQPALQTEPTDLILLMLHLQQHQ
jgi:hypothetical protein